MPLFTTPTSTGAKKKGPFAQGCEGCNHQYNAKHPKIKAQGQGKKGILIVTDTPSAADDISGLLLSEEDSFRRLKDTLRKFNCHIEKDCWVTTAVRCRCPDSNSNDIAIGQCSPNILREIKQLKPRVVILLGRAATRGVINSRLTGRLNGTPYNAFYSETIPDQQLKAWLCPTYSPHEIHRTMNKKNKKVDPVTVLNFERDIENAVAKATAENYEFPNNEPKEKDTRIIWDVEDAIEYLDIMHDFWAGSKALIEFDFETSGLKPQAEGHFIECVSIADHKESVCMPFFIQNEKFCAAFKKVMTNDEIGKVAHNDPFEDRWVYFRAGYMGEQYKVVNWAWDTLLAEHMIHNQKPCGQKYLVYKHFGVLNYDEDIAHYLEGEGEKDENGFNRIQDAPKDKLYHYCALDSFWCRKLRKKQQAWFAAHPHLDFDFLLDGQMEALSELHIQGQLFDVEHAINQKVDIEHEIKERLEALKKGEFGLGWDGTTSGNNFYKHVYTTLGLKNVDKKQAGSGKSGKQALDIEVMEKMNHPFTNEILEIKKLEKIVGTYLDGYLHECVDGKVHPYYKLLTVTLRGNSSNPNAQNVPKHNTKIKNIIRSCIKPGDDYRFMAWDYKALETMIAACNYPDKNWLAYASDLKSDMHWDWTHNLFDLQDDFVSLMEETEYDGKIIRGVVRQNTKSDAVFPGIYGASPFSIAPSLYKHCKLIPLMWEYFREKGWDDPKVFLKHVIAKYEWYWGEWFPEYKDLREEDWDKFQIDGYTDTLNGCRYTGPFGYTEFCNWKTQGPASHVKLWSMAQAAKEVKEEGLRSTLAWEIHDEFAFKVYAGEENEVNRISRYWGVEGVMERWPWIIVPLVLEGEMTEVGGSWAKMVKFDVNSNPV
jgi:uracil-DNA glycosylase family 4